MSFELRFLRKPSTTTERDRLQYRVTHVNSMTGHEWSQWHDVPVVIEPALASGELPKQTVTILQGRNRGTFNLIDAPEALASSTDNQLAAKEPT